MAVQIPSISALRAFEAVARHLSFSRAALELHLTQSAVSHQIKNLELTLGERLIERLGNKVSLTDAGRDYLGAVRPALFELSAATTRIAEARGDGSLTVACLNGFGTKCLLPSLPDFRSRHPEVALRITTVTSFEHLERHDYDVSIRYGTGDWPGSVVERITSEDIFPVCSPSFLKAGDLAAPASLARRTVVKTESHVLRDFWPLWCEAAGLGPIVFEDVITCDTLTTSISAAISGLGVAIGRSTVVEGDLRAGVLVEPFTIRVPAGSEGYYLVVAPERSRLRKVLTFRDWLISTFSNARRR
jgi:LysR family transcriptional regulator, glycine cleavage system transcriptional activator